MKTKKYIIGSKLLGLKDNHDEDVLVIVEDEDVNLYKREVIDGKDQVTRSVLNIERQMNFELPITFETARYYIINYQLDADIIKQDFPLEYHILDKRDKYIELLKWIVKNKACNFVKEGFNNGNCSKMIYHIEYLTYILENNSTELTDVQKEIIQKTHNKQMPSSYISILANKINNLR